MLILKTDLHTQWLLLRKTTEWCVEKKPGGKNDSGKKSLVEKTPGGKKAWCVL